MNKIDRAILEVIPSLVTAYCEDLLTMNKKQALQAMLDGKVVTLDYLKNTTDLTVWYYDNGFYKRDWNKYREKFSEPRLTSSAWGDETVDDGWVEFELPPEPPRQKMLTEDEVREALIAFMNDGPVRNSDDFISSLFGEESDD
jgi:hypothetical protein